jgi:outer membrane biosynthesis protein TonB
MKHFRIIQTAACAALLVAALAPRAVKADEWNKKTIMNFSGTVQVPGATLPAGSYVFKLLDSPSNRYVVQVFNERENHVFATIMAIPNYRLEPPDKTVVTFYEAPAGQPLPVRAWFYPGDNYGREFVYSKSEAALIAKATNQEVKTEETTIVAQNTAPVQSPEVATEPEAVAVAPAEPTPAPAVAEPEPQPEESPLVRRDESTAEPDQTPAPTPAADTPAPSTDSSLPATASQLQLVLLLGLLSIGGALSMRAVRRLNN